MANGSGESISDIYVQIRLEADQLKREMRKIPQDAEKIAKSVEDSFKRKRIDMDNRLMRMKLSEVQQLHKNLQQQLAQKIRLNADINSIRKTSEELKSVEGALNKVKAGAEDIHKPDKFNFKQMALGALAATVAITGLFRVIRQSIENSIRQAKAEIQLKTAIETTGMAAGFTANQLKKMASELQALMGIGDEDILSSVTNQLLTFTQITGDTFKRAQIAVLDLNAVINQGEISSLKTQAIQLGKALENPIMGIGALSRAGITFTDVQKKMIRNFIEKNDLLSAQNIILDEVNNKYGNQAKALNEATKGAQNLKASFGDVLELLGDFIMSIPGVQQGLNALSTGFQKLIAIFKGEENLRGLKTIKANLQDLEDVAQQVSMNELKVSTQESRDALKKYTEEQIAIIKQNETINLQKKRELIIHEATLKAIKNYEKNLKPIEGAWTRQGKTIGELQDRIASLQDQLLNLTPDLDSKKIKEINAEIASLNSLISSAAATQNNLIDETIKKIQTQNELKSLTSGLSQEIMEASIATLEKMLQIAKTDEDRVKLLREIKKLNEEIASIQPPKIEFEEEPEIDILPDIDLEGRKRALRELQSLQISAIDNEFEQREALINQQYELQLENLQGLFDQELINELELNNAISDLQKKRENELAALSRQRFEAVLNLAGSISNVLQKAFGNNELVQNMQKALEIAQAIKAVFDAIKILSFLGNPAAPIAAAPGLKEGGLFHKGKVTPYKNIPKFQTGGDFTVPSKFSNDSFLMRVSANEKVKVTPAHKTGDTEKLLSAINSSIHAMNLNLIRKDLSVNIENRSPEVEVLVKRLKKVENQLSIAGMNFNER